MDGTKWIRAARWGVGLAAIGLAGCQLFGSSPIDQPPTLQTGERTESIRQHGVAPLVKTKDDWIQIDYPRPFATTPKLTLGGPGSVSPDDVHVLKETKTFFAVHWKATGGEAILAWTAEGPPAGGK